MSDQEHQDPDQFEDENESIIRAKWAMDGAATLSEAAQKLRSFADSLISMERDGWQLQEPVEDDYGFVRKDADHG